MHRDGRGHDRQAASTPVNHNNPRSGRQICASCCHEPVHSLASTVRDVTTIPCRQASVINHSANRAGRQLLAWLNPGRHCALSSWSARSKGSGIWQFRNQPSSLVFWGRRVGSDGAAVRGRQYPLCHILHRIGSTACSTCA
jgi:hypothetical protein